MVSMRSDWKMQAFLPNFLGEKILAKQKVSADFWANRPGFRENCAFIENFLTREYGKKKKEFYTKKPNVTIIQENENIAMRFDII